MKRLSFFKAWLFQVIAGAVAWNCIFAASAMLGQLLDMRFWPMVMIWLWVGLVVLLLKHVDFAVPTGDHVDVKAMFVLLWQAAQWPKYLL